MNVSDRCLPPALPVALANAIRSPIHRALAAVRTTDSGLVVNDTEWLAVRGKKLSPVVMNSATFISQGFQAWLEKKEGWRIEYEAEEQTIDAYTEIVLPFEGRYLTENGLRALIDHFWLNRDDFAPIVQQVWPFVAEPSVDQVVWWLTQMYFKRRIHDVSPLPESLHRHFQSTGEVDHRIRVGLEFESGYTASAYRAFVKLNLFYAIGLIDVGVFVATDKANAVRIWPASNRNVNFDELENRRYRRNIYFPVWEVLFSPDAYSSDAEYLGDNGCTYLPSPTSSTHLHRGHHRTVYTRGDGKLLIESSPIAG